MNRLKETQYLQRMQNTVLPSTPEITSCFIEMYLESIQIAVSQLVDVKSKCNIHSVVYIYISGHFFGHKFKNVLILGLDICSNLSEYLYITVS